MTKNSEIENSPVWVLPNIWRLGRVRDTNFSTECCKMPGLQFDRFWVIEGKPTGGGKITPPTMIKTWHFEKKVMTSYFLTMTSPVINPLTAALSHCYPRLLNILKCFEQTDYKISNKQECTLNTRSLLEWKHKVNIANYT